MFKKLLSLVLVIGLMGSSLAFAGEAPKQREAAQPKGDEKLIEIVTTYAPELLPNFEAAIAEHQSVHVQLEAKATERFTSQLEAHQLFLADITSKLRSGEIDRATAKQMIEARRTEVKTQREAVKAEIQALKASFNLSPEVNKAMMQTLKTAIEAEDTALITETLNAIYSTLLTHIQFDYAKLAME